MAGPIPDLNFNLGISPVSGSGSGFDYFEMGGPSIGSVNFGSTDQDTAVSPVIRDAATAIAVILGAVWVWKQVNK